MKINSKEEFVKLLLAVMARYGYLIESFNFSKELPMMVEDKRYDNLFYYVYSLKDLDILDELFKYQDMGYIELVLHDNNIVTIHISTNFSYQIGRELLEQFDESLIVDMYRFIRELDITRSIGCTFLEKVKTKFMNVNPNGIYHLSKNESIVTDGLVSKKSGAVVIEEARFLTIQEFVRQQLRNFNVYYKFDDRMEIMRFTKDILTFHEHLDNRRRGLPVYGKLEIDEKFKKLELINGYHYKNY